MRKKWYLVVRKGRFRDTRFVRSFAIDTPSRAWDIQIHYIPDPARQSVGSYERPPLLQMEVEVI